MNVWCAWVNFCVSYLYGFLRHQNCSYHSQIIYFISFYYITKAESESMDPHETTALFCPLY